MKKLIAMLLCVALVAALGVQAFAYSADDVTTSKAQTATEKAISDATKAKQTEKGTHEKQDAYMTAVYNAAKAYEDVLADASATAEQKAAAKVAADAKLSAIATVYGDTYYAANTYDSYDHFVANHTSAAAFKTNGVDVVKDWIKADDAAIKALNDFFATAKADGDKSRALKKIQEDYKGATGIKAQERDAMTTQLLASWAKADAEKAAKAAKDAVVAAQKSAVTTAKTEVAAAVANAQAKAYNELAAAYSAAVADLGTQLKEAIEGLH